VACVKIDIKFIGSRLLLTINNIEFASQLKKVEGNFPLSAMERIQDMLLASLQDATQKQAFLEAVSKTQVTYSLQGLPERFYGEQSLPMLSLKLDVQLPLICQRCLSPMSQLLALNYEYAIADEPSEALLEDDEVDWLELDAQMYVAALVEDELIMALPISPVHGFACTELNMQSGEKANPFAVLKGKF
jgi:uncharacterized protein